MKKKFIFAAAVIFVFSLISAVFASLFFEKASAATAYDLWVAGTQVTSDTLSGNGWKYEPDTNTLVLNGFSYGSGGYGYRLGYDSGLKADVYAFIYVKDNNKKAMNLNVRIEGAKSTVGDSSLTAYEAVSAGDGYYATYYGIYNRYGNVTITGSAKLYIHTNKFGILANNITFDGCTGLLDLRSYSASVYATNTLTVKNGSKIEAYCGFGGKLTHNSPIYAAKTINIYDSSEVNSTIERAEDATDEGVSGIYCGGTINVYGGKLSGTSYAQGKKPSTSQPVSIGIRTSVLNVSGGGVVEAYVNQGSGQKSYLNSGGICERYAESGTINIKGSGIVRIGIEKKNPDGETPLYGNFNVADGLKGISTAIRSDNYERYLEFTSYEHEGVFVKTEVFSKKLSYYRNFIPEFTYPSGDVPALSDVIAAGSGLDFYVLSGIHTFDPRLSDGSVPAITVEEGMLTLKLQSGKTYTMTKPITLNENTILVIEGNGIITGLDIRGQGKVLFNGGTVTGKVASTVETVVNGGNIDISYDGTVKDKYGYVVTKREYTVTSDKTISSVNLIKLRSRDYGSEGIYPTDGKKLYLWTTSEGEVLYANAVLSDGSTTLTLNSAAGNPLLLGEGYGIETTDLPLIVIANGDSTTINPFRTAPTEEQMKDYRLVWEYYDSYDGWVTISDNIDNMGKYTISSDVISNRGIGNYNHQLRCRIYYKANNELAGEFSTLVHLFKPVIIRGGSTDEGSVVTLTIGEDTEIPEELNYEWRGIGWSMKRADGIVILLSESSGKRTHTFILKEEHEKCEFYCSADLYVSGDNQCSGYATATIPEVTNKTAKIDGQPTNNVTLDLDDESSEATISVTARNATRYQWQVSKRLTADDTSRPFEDIDGATEASYTLKSSEATAIMANYVYRCVVGNDVNEVITDEVKFDFRLAPRLVEKPDITAITLDEKDGTTFSVVLNLGLPEYNYGIYWTISPDNGKHFYGVNYFLDTLGMAGKFDETKTRVTPDVTLIISNLKLINVDKSMNGYLILCNYRFGNGQYQHTETITLTVIPECEKYGHKGGTATCRNKAVCEVCGEEYGEINPDNHIGKEEWNEKDWNTDVSGHIKMWSCCYQISYAYENHIFENGVCTVCGCVCNHSHKIAATCHEEGKCSSCGLKTEDINPNNHDFYPSGTFTRDQKDPTCTEEGYTGDTICWNCLGVVTAGSVIPANGHDTSWKATCKEPAYCNVCGEHYGEKDPNNHAEPHSAYYTNVTETTHEEHWNCCDMVTTLPHNLDENGVCTLCHYGCNHTGGTANCVEPAICEICGEQYGDVDPNNHEHTRYYPNEDNTHTEYCACGKAMSAPEPHNWEDGTCTVCFTMHFDHVESDWIIESLPAFGTDGSRRKDCTICHMLMAYETIDALSFDTITVRHNCSFGNDLSMLYAILKSDLSGCTDITLTVKKEVYEGNTLKETSTKTLTPTEYIIKGTVYYRFDYNLVAAKEMGDTLTAELNFLREGATYSGTVDTYSLKEYATERLESSNDETFKTLLVDLLNYGAAAQTYFGYRTDKLVNAELTDVQKALARQTYESLKVAGNTDDGKVYTSSITGKNVLFDTRIMMLVATDLQKDDDLDGISIKIRYQNFGGQTVEKLIGGTNFVYRADANGYTVRFDDLKASELRTELEITIVKDGTPISATVKYSFDNYANNRLKNSSDDNFKKLLEKTLLYSDSAKAYFSSTN